MKNNHKPGILYLIPSSLGTREIQSIWPEANVRIVHTLDHFIVENFRTARRFLKSTGYLRSFDEVHFGLLNKYTAGHELSELLQPLAEGISAGLLSEAGCPGIADPGQELVARAHDAHIPVKPLVGPSSILLALMASGMNGQSFCFHGYLPIKTPERKRKLRELEKESSLTGKTQIFMETPFRNNALLNEILQCCKSSTRLSVAVDLTMESEYIRTRDIGQWKDSGMPDLNKRPAIFLLSG